MGYLKSGIDGRLRPGKTRNRPTTAAWSVNNQPLGGGTPDFQ